MVAALAVTGGIAQAALNRSDPKPRPIALDRAVTAALRAPGRRRHHGARQVHELAAAAGALPRGPASPLRVRRRAGACGWRDGRLRLELQSGVRRRPGRRRRQAPRVYDAATNTVYRADLAPATRRPAREGRARRRSPSVEGLCRARWPSRPRLRRRADLDRRPARPTRCGRAQARRRGCSARPSWPGMRRAACRCASPSTPRAATSPVLELEATEISYGRGRGRRLGRPARGREGRRYRSPATIDAEGAKGEARRRGGRRSRRRLDSSSRRPTSSPGCRAAACASSRRRRLPGAVSVYGKGLGVIAVIQREASASTAGPRRAASARRPAPQINIDGATGHELADGARHGRDVRAQRRGYTSLGSRPAGGRRGGARGACDDGRAPPIEARGLVKRYGHITAVDHVDLTVGAGDVYGYLGPNGAGKTTSLRMLLGLIRPDAGSARCSGATPSLEGAARARRRRRIRRGAALLPVPERAAQPRAGGGARRRRGGRAASTRRSTPSTSRTGPTTASAATRTACASGSGSRGRWCATRGCCCSTSRRPGWIPAGMRDMRLADPPAGRPGHHRAALLAPHGRGRGAVRPRRDRARGPRPSTKARCRT